MATPVTAEAFAELRASTRPAVFRGLVGDWPAVEAARENDVAICRYLAERASARPVNAIAAPPSADGRFFYTDDLRQLNFVKASGQLASFLEDLLHARSVPQPPAMAVQSEDIASLAPRFAADNRLDLLPAVAPRIWIGNRIKVAPHYDAKENVACCVAGRRRFTLFPPSRTPDLYPGPFETTPAGTPVSMVDPSAPDLDRYPRFAEAWKDAKQATLEPGDAIYIPYGWWHGVESLEPVSILVNYWWTPDLPEGIGSPYDALLHMMLAFRHLPRDEKEVWRELLDYYVFERSGDPGAHLPDHAKGILGPPSPELFGHMRRLIRHAMGPGD
ncbi:cupin-like domain-containing protein [Altererythrobacter sp. HHU K3-1]|uniref:Cupin-like domain-containing protein n=1 Tax=Qipengyuania atrilutea TaxID=2744473 RepID=A0A850H0F6_9SPHN|nr:cupin-like domain-containing protein [Actirhodobacter atriluteus]